MTLSKEADPATCGVAEHHYDCLCDVHITTPAPIRFGFDEVWGADVVRRANGWDGEQGGAALASFLEALAYGYDNTRHLEGFEANWTHDGGVLRKQVLELLAGRVSIIDIPNIVGDSLARVVSVLTDGKTSPVWVWSEARWAEWEDAIRQPTATAYTIHREFGLAQSTTRRMMAKFGVDVVDANKKARLDRIKELAATTDMRPSEIGRLLAKEGHVTHYDVSVDSMVRRITDRIRKKKK